jgi:hypothetical protein
MRARKIILVLSVLIFFQKYAVAQGIDQDKLIRMRDSLDNLLIVNPTTSAILVKQHELELYSFSSLLNNTKFNDKQGNSTNFDGKQILFNSTFQINYGVSRNRRINIGADLNYRAYRYDANEGSPATSIFKNDAQNAGAFTYAGLRVRLQPFKRLYNFTYQSNIWLPVASAENQTSLNASKVNWGNTFFYYKYFQNKIGLFTQANFTIALPGANSEADAKTEMYIPLNATLSYVANRKNILFGSLSYSWITTDISKTFEGGDSDFAQFGIGYQRVFTRNFSLMFNYNGTIMSRNYGSWNGLNLGIRYLY